MQIDLRTVSINPLRQTFGHLARRMGADKPASRYFEATMDLQPVENFHYRPSWEPDKDIFDPQRTKIQMRDWYDLKDPRQYYYGTWVLARGRMQETAEGDFDLVEEMGLAHNFSEAGKQKAYEVFLPLRHLAWGSNLNKCHVAAYSYGIAMSQAACYASMDQLGVAQYLSRLALAFQDPEVLVDAKQQWIESPVWQPLRQLTEDLMVVKDWYEVWFVQDVLLEGLLYPLVFERFNDQLNSQYGPVCTLLTRFPREWFNESSKWVDAVLKATVAESAQNKEQLLQWSRQWLPQVLAAVKPIADLAFAEQSAPMMEEVLEQLEKRTTKVGLSLGLLGG